MCGNCYCRLHARFDGRFSLLPTYDRFASGSSVVDAKRNSDTQFISSNIPLLSFYRPLTASHTMFIPLLGVVTKQCEIQGTMFEIYDIGFKRSSKPEWMQFFSTAKAVIYVADLTDYDRFVMVNRKRKNKLVRYHTINLQNYAYGSGRIFWSFICSSICLYFSPSLIVCICVYIFLLPYLRNNFNHYVFVSTNIFFQLPDFVFLSSIQFIYF